MILPEPIRAASHGGASCPSSREYRRRSVQEALEAAEKPSAPWRPRRRPPIAARAPLATPSGRSSTRSNGRGTHAERAGIDRPPAIEPEDRPLGGTSSGKSLTRSPSGGSFGGRHRPIMSSCDIRGGDGHLNDGAARDNGSRADRPPAPAGAQRSPIGCRQRPSRQAHLRRARAGDHRRAAADHARGDGGDEPVTLLANVSRGGRDLAARPRPRSFRLDSLSSHGPPTA